MTAATFPLNRVKVTTATTGTGTVTLGGAVASYQTFANAGAVSGIYYSYLIEDGLAWELGVGIYDSGAGTLTRSPNYSSVGGAALNLSGTATVAISTVAGDNLMPEEPWRSAMLADFATTRLGTGSITQSDRGIIFSAPGTSTNTNSLIYALRTITAGAAGWRLTARISRVTPFAQYAATGILIRNATSGASVAFALGLDQVTGFNRAPYTSDTAVGTVIGVALWYELDFWIRIEDDLTNRNIFVSKDGWRWQRIYQEARTTTITPDQVGFFMNPNLGGTTTGIANLRNEVAMIVRSSQYEVLS